MKLPFKINDGKVTRQCTYDDLWIINEMHLPVVVYGKKTFLWIFRQKLTPGDKIVRVLYAGVRAIKMSNYVYKGLSIMNSTRVHSIECPELHKYRNSKLIKMIMDLD